MDDLRALLRVLARAVVIASGTAALLYGVTAHRWGWALAWAAAAAFAWSAGAKKRRYVRRWRSIARIMEREWKQR